MELLKTIKYKGQFHKRGSKIKVDKADIDRFIKNGIIKPHNKPLKEERDQEPIEKETPLKQSENALKNDLTVAEIKLMLDNNGIEYTSNLRKDELLELLEGV